MKTKHERNPLNDFLGNVEAFLKIINKFGFDKQ